MERFPIAVPAHIQAVNGHDPSACCETVSRDVCAAGAFFLTCRPLEVGTDVLVRLVLPPPGPGRAPSRRAEVTVSGKVLRTDGVGMAVQFNRRYSISSAAV